VFRAAYDFMCIQTMVGLLPHKLCRWWTEYQQNNAPETESQSKERRSRPRRRRRNAN
jgi:hypothetical protein